jgi:plasmid stabilization system protein ParE
LVTNPFIGVVSSNPQIRILPPTRYPYRIYYTVQGEDVVILHIRHTARLAPDDLGL